MITSGLTFTPSPSQLPTDPSKKVDYKMEFLQMFMTQLKNQDPTQPVDSTQMLAQQAQFASLEQMQNLNTNLVTLLAMQNVSQATNLIGKTAAGNDVNGAPVQGTVVGITFEGGTSTLKIDTGGGVLADVKLPSVTEIGL